MLSFFIHHIVHAEDRENAIMGILESVAHGRADLQDAARSLEELTSALHVRSCAVLLGKSCMMMAAMSVLVLAGLRGIRLFRSQPRPCLSLPQWHGRKKSQIL